MADSSTPQWPSLSRRGAMALGAASALSTAMTPGWAALAGGYRAMAVMLDLDGVLVPLRSSSGGNWEAEVATVQGAPDGSASRRTTGFHVTDLTLEVALGQAGPLQGLVDEFFAGRSRTRNGGVIFVDLNGNQIKRLSFFDALLVEVNVSPNDATGREAMFMALRFVVGRATLDGPGPNRVPVMGNKAHQVLSTSFAFNVAGLDAARNGVLKVSGVGLKRKIAREVGGMQRLPSSTFASSEFATLSVVLSEAHGAPMFYKWLTESMAAGAGQSKLQRSAELHWLAPDMRTVMGSAVFTGLSIVGYAPEPHRPGADAILTVQVDMIYDALKLNLPR